MGTDAYGEVNKENNFLYLSIKDGNGKEYIRCTIDEELLEAMKLEHGFLFMQLPKSFTYEYTLEGYLMCFFTEEEIEKIRNGSWDS